MTENSDIIQCGVDDCAEGDKSDRGEQCRRKIQWNSRPYHNVKVAIVRPLSNSQDSHSSGSGTTDSPPTPVLSPFLQTQRRLRQRDISGQTRLEPFSFDERDTLQRVAYERRLEELRHVEERQRLSVTSFRANAVRRYKPLVLRQSTRPLTVPRNPFSRHDDV